MFFFETKCENSITIIVNCDHWQCHLQPDDETDHKSIIYVSNVGIVFTRPAL